MMFIFEIFVWQVKRKKRPLEEGDAAAMPPTSK